MKSTIFLPAMTLAVLTGILGAIITLYLDMTSFFGTEQLPVMQTSGNFLEYSSFGLCILSSLVALAAGTLPTRQKATYGTAHFATPTDLQNAELIQPRLITEKNKISPSYLELGTYRRLTIGLSERKQESHVILIAPTGKRKTSGIIIPGLLSERGSRSLFINDVKGELIGKCIGALSCYMHCQVLSPTRPAQSQCYNPLAFVESMEDAEDLATCLVENTGISHEPFWNMSAKLLLTAVILHLRLAEPDAPFSTIADVLSGSSLEGTKDLLLSSPSDLAKEIATAFIKNLSLNEKLAGSIMTDIAVRLFSLKNPTIRQITATNELCFDMNEPTALFLSIPASSTKRLKWLSSCLVMQLMKKLIVQAEQSKTGRLQRGFAFYLDEFANAGKIPHFAEHISLVRSAGIAFIMAAQDFGQLTREYGEDDKNTILSNATTHIVFPGCGLPETQYYSERIGETTVTTISSGASSSRYQSQTSRNKSEAQRRLMTADELRTMPIGNLLIVSDNIHPFIVQNRTYLDRPEMEALISLPYTPPVRLAASSHYDSLTVKNEETQSVIKEEEFIKVLPAQNEEKEEEVASESDSELKEHVLPVDME